MEAEMILMRLREESHRSSSVKLTRREMDLVLDKINQLESMFADLLRSQLSGSKSIVIQIADRRATA